MLFYFLSSYDMDLNLFLINKRLLLTYHHDDMVSKVGLDLDWMCYKGAHTYRCIKLTGGSVKIGLSTCKISYIASSTFCTLYLTASAWLQCKCYMMMSMISRSDWNQLLKDHPYLHPEMGLPWIHVPSNQANLANGQCYWLYIIPCSKKYLLLWLYPRYTIRQPMTILVSFWWHMPHIFKYLVKSHILFLEFGHSFHHLFDISIQHKNRYYTLLYLAVLFTKNMTDLLGRRVVVNS